MALKIKKIFAYEVLDSRGYPTVACVVKVGGGGILSGKDASARAIIPSGASTGDKEAIELRDGDITRYMGKGVKKAVQNINQIIGPKLIDSNIAAENQKEIDDFMKSLDGTSNKSILGANAILAVSLAIAKAVSNYNNIPFYKYIERLYGANGEKKFTMPLPLVNVINGGAHADNTIDFQEFMFVPVGAKSMHEAVRVSSECFHALAGILKSQGYSTAKGDEGGFAPNLKSTEEALSYMLQAVVNAGFTPGILNGQVAFALDCAASELYDKEEGVYVFKKAYNAKLLSKEAAHKTTDEMIEYLEKLVKKFPIISIEDPLDENDWLGFAKLVERLGSHVQIVGDDLFCTNPRILTEGVERKTANSVLVKLNQIGTLSETIEAIQIAQQAGWTAIISHRSGETEDTSIADLAVGTYAGQIKTGSMSRSERIAKYNRLLEIEMELNTEGSIFRGLNSFTNLDLTNPENFTTFTYKLTDNEKNLSKLLASTKSKKKSKSKRGRKPKSQALNLVTDTEEESTIVKAKRGRKKGTKNKLRNSPNKIKSEVLKPTEVLTQKVTKKIKKKTKK